MNKPWFFVVLIDKLFRAACGEGDELRSKIIRVFLGQQDGGDAESEQKVILRCVAVMCYNQTHLFFIRNKPVF